MFNAVNHVNTLAMIVVTLLFLLSLAVVLVDVCPSSRRSVMLAAPVVDVVEKGHFVAVPMHVVLQLVVQVVVLGV